MKNLLAEQPLILSAMLGVLAAACLYGWLQTGKRGAGVLALIFAALIPCVWLIANLWKTDREIIRELIYETASAVEANDIDRAVRVIGPSYEGIASRARAELANYEFTQARVNKINKIDVIEASVPKRAEVEMSVTVDVTSKRGQFANIRVPRRLFLEWEKLPDGRWVVIGYDHSPLVGDRDGFSPALPQP